MDEGDVKKSEETGKLYKRLHNQVKRAKQIREQWNGRFDEIIEFFLPEKVYTSNARNPEDSAGSTPSRRLYDNHQVDSAEDGASAIYGTLINPSVKYMSLHFMDEELDNKVKARKVMKARSDGIMNAFANPDYGFPTASAELFLMLMTIGTSGMMVTEGKHGPKFDTIPTPDLYLTGNGNSSDSGIRSVVTTSMMTPREIMTDFPNASIPAAIQQEANESSGRKPKTYEVAQIFEERVEGDPAPLNEKHKVNHFVIMLDKKCVLHHGGFNEMPIITPRISVVAGQVYGRSPAMRAMPNVLSLQKLAQIDMIAKQMSSLPPLMVEARAAEGPIRYAPGSIFYIRRGRMAGVKSLDRAANVSASDKAIEDKRRAIDRTFFRDAFVMPDFDRATTLEVQTFLQQRQQLLGPVVNRIFAEFMVPVVNRVAAILERKKIIPAIPEEFKNHKTKVVFVGQLALNQRVSEISNMQSWLQMNLPVMDSDPRAKETFDADFFMRHSATLLNVPVGMLRTEEEVEERVKKMEESQQIEAASQLSGAYKDAGQGAAAFSKVGT